MNDVFSALATPLLNRPGEPLSTSERKKLDCRQMRKAGVRSPNAYLPQRPNPWNLSPIRCVLMDHLVQGKGNGEIAEQMGIAIKTVEANISVILGDMGGVSRVRAAVLWDRFMRGDQQAEQERS